MGIVMGGLWGCNGWLAGLPLLDRQLDLLPTLLPLHHAQPPDLYQGMRHLALYQGMRHLALYQGMPHLIQRKGMHHELHLGIPRPTLRINHGQHLEAPCRALKDRNQLQGTHRPTLQRLGTRRGLGRVAAHRLARS